MLPNQKRTAHKKNSFKPQRCSYPGCASEQVFGERKQYGGHLRSSHNARDKIDEYVQDNPEQLVPTTPPRIRAKRFKPQKCTHPECPSHATFGERHKFVVHLEEYHGVWRDDDIALFISSESLHDMADTSVEHQLLERPIIPAYTVIAAPIPKVISSIPATPATPAIPVLSTTPSLVINLTNSSDTVHPPSQVRRYPARNGRLPVQDYGASYGKELEEDWSPDSDSDSIEEDDDDNDEWSEQDLTDVDDENDTDANDENNTDTDDDNED
ncbi:hypothetical protein ACHAQD_001049 [Fusarium lateritium]